uniref:MAM domain-containing protein n=1 Tax=Globodera pallida TaxID=36090 RepID=A0A183CIJ3_GLOPA
MRARNRRWTEAAAAAIPLPNVFFHTAFVLIHLVDREVLACTSMSGSVMPGLSSSPLAVGPSGGGGGGGGGGGAGAARAAPNLPLSPIALLGPRVTIAEFGSDGYNSQGGGPVPDALSLNCDFEGQQPCCWANVPTPTDDQIDWVQVEGQPQSSLLPRNVSVDGKYLVAYASAAAPSDEAQLSSCAIACASTSIRVRARHMQTSNVLLQVCQRESFPPSLGFNPLLNCQEFPTSSGRMINTELVLPKASYVDIIFVASNFIGERGDVVLLDDIQILYDSNPPDCGAPSTTTTTTTTFVPITMMPKKKQKTEKKSKSSDKTIMEVDSHGLEVDEDTEDDDGPDKVRRAELIPPVDGGRKRGTIGRSKGRGRCAFWHFLGNLV